MKGIGGNTTAILQISTVTENAIGEQIQAWADTEQLKGWLDLLSGEARYTVFDVKIQQSTHIFVCDYSPIAASVTAENARMVIDGKRYDVMLIDNPMGMGYRSHLEIYLKFTGGQ